MPAALYDALYRLALKAVFLLLRVYWLLRRPQATGVLVAVWHDGRILLVKNSYRSQYNFPGGGPKAGETPLATARRELAEETGLTVSDNDLSALGVFRSEFEHRRDQVHLFEVTLAQRPATRLDNREVVWAEFVEPDRALTLALAPTLRRYLKDRTRSADNAEPDCH